MHKINSFNGIKKGSLILYGEPQTHSRDHLWNTLEEGKDRCTLQVEGASHGRSGQLLASWPRLYLMALPGDWHVEPKKLKYSATTVPWTKDREDALNLLGLEYEVIHPQVVIDKPYMYEEPFVLPKEIALGSIEVSECTIRIEDVDDTRPGFRFKRTYFVGTSPDVRTRDRWAKVEEAIQSDKYEIVLRLKEGR